MVNHANDFVDANTEVHTNVIKGIWKGIKAKVQKRSVCKDENLQEKLGKFAFRKTLAKDPKTNFSVMTALIAAYLNVV